MFIPDTTDNARSFELSLDTVARWVVTITAVVVIVICLFLSLLLKSHKSIYSEDGFITRIETLEAENRELKAELGRSEAPVSGESVETRSVTSDKKQERRVRTDVPGVLPIDGKATIVKDPFDDADEHKERLVFMSLAGSSVIVTADGTVQEISEDGTLAYTVTIDHKNGYRSVYAFDGTPLVTEGSEVKQGDKLFVSEDEDFLSGYEIIFGGDPVDPSQID